MKKIILLLVCTVLMTACIGPFKKESGEVKKTQNKGENVVGNALKNALQSGKTMRCTYMFGDTEVETLVKGKKTRVNGMNMGQGEGVMINDGEWVYMWDEQSKTGTKYNIEEMEAMSGDEADDKSTPEGVEDPEEWAAKMDEQFDIKCENARVADSEFTPPADVTFSDMGSYMKKATEFNEKMEGKTDFNEEDMEEINEMMEEMGEMMQ